MVSGVGGATWATVTEVDDGREGSGGRLNLGQSDKRVLGGSEYPVRLADGNGVPGIGKIGIDRWNGRNRPVGRRGGLSGEAPSRVGKSQEDGGDDGDYNGVAGSWVRHLWNTINGRGGDQVTVTAGSSRRYVVDRGS